MNNDKSARCACCGHWCVRELVPVDNVLVCTTCLREHWKRTPCNIPRCPGHRPPEDAS